MHTTSRFLQGIYSFEGQGLSKPIPIDPGLTYTVPPGVTGQALYFRGGNSTDEMITIVLVRDGQPMRYFPIGARDGTHVPLRVVEVVCGDDAEHRRRVEARYASRDHDGVPDWVRVLERQAEYEPYLGPRLVVDTFLAKEPVPPVVSYLS